MISWLSIGPTDVLHARLVLAAWNVANAKLYYPPDLMPNWSQADGIVLHAFSQWWNTSGKTPIVPLGVVKDGVTQAELTDAHLAALDKWAAQTGAQVPVPPALDIPAGKALLGLWSKTDGSGATGALLDYGLQAEDLTPTWTARDATELKAFSAWWNGEGNTPTLNTTGILSVDHGVALKNWAANAAAKVPSGWQAPPAQPATIPTTPPAQPPLPTQPPLPPPPGPITPTTSAEPAGTPWWLWVGGAVVLGAGIWTLSKVLNPAGGSPSPGGPAANPLQPRWDPNSGIRERLFLLSQIDPGDFRLISTYRYNAKKDYWHTDELRPGVPLSLKVTTEGSASLAKLAEMGVTRREAMEMIGFPDTSANPLPAKIIDWNKIGRDDKVTLKGKPKSQYYVVTHPNGKKALAIWSGHDAREAQRWLDAKVSQDALRARGRMQDNPKGSRRIGTFGDVNPVDYGGGVIYRNEHGIRIEYTHGFGEGTARDLVYLVPVPDDVLAEHTWVDVFDVASSSGREVAELQEMSRSRNVLDRVSVIEDIAGHYGWIELDNYPLSMTEKELRRRWRMY